MQSESWLGSGCLWRSVTRFVWRTVCQFDWGTEFRFDWHLTSAKQMHWDRSTSVSMTRLELRRPG